MRKAKPKKRLAKIIKTAIPIEEWNKLNDKFMEATKQYTPSQPLTLCGQLEDSILLLENRISNAIAKINSLM